MPGPLANASRNVAADVLHLICRKKGNPLGGPVSSHTPTQPTKLPHSPGSLLYVLYVLYGPQPAELPLSPALPRVLAVYMCYGMRSVGLVPGLCPQKAGPGVANYRPLYKPCRTELSLLARRVLDTLRRHFHEDAALQHRARERPCQAGERATQTLRA